MRHRTGFGNCNDVAVADGPGQRNSGCRAAVCCADTYKWGITQQAGTGSAERRISHHRHAVLLAPWQQVTLYAAVAEAVRELIIYKRLGDRPHVLQGRFSGDSFSFGLSRHHADYAQTRPNLRKGRARHKSSGRASRDRRLGDRRNRAMSECVKVFGCRPMTTAPRTPGPASANLQAKKP